MSNKMPRLQRNGSMGAVRCLKKPLRPTIDSISNDKNPVSFEPISTAC